MKCRNLLVLVCIVTLLLGLQKVFAEEAPIENGHEEMVANDSSVDSVGDQEEYVGTSASFFQGFVETFTMIVLSELGDKTFFIAAIMAMKHPRWTVFIGATSALGVMHVLSALFGFAITVIPRLYTYYLSSFLFAVFGIKMLREGWKMSPNEGQEEFDKVQEDLRKKDAETESSASLETGQSTSQSASMPYKEISRIFIQAFTLTFLAEWGDRSQLATIVFAARENIWAVVIAGILGHALCTGLAVIGGRMIAQRISVRTVTIIGGFVFIAFALTALFLDPEAESVFSFATTTNATYTSANTSTYAPDPQTPDQMCYTWENCHR